MLFWLIVALFSIPIVLWGIYPLLKPRQTKADTRPFQSMNSKRFRWPLAVFLAALIFIGGTYTYLYQSNGYNMMIALEEIENHREALLDLIEEEKKKLAKEPDNAVGWLVLARAYQTLDQYDDAALAYAQLEKLGGLKGNELALAYAEALILAERQYPKARQLLEQVLLDSPEQKLALYLYGSLEFRNGSYRQAIDRWKKLQTIVGDSLDAQWQQELARMIQTAEAHAAALETTLQAQEKKQLPETKPDDSEKSKRDEQRDDPREKQSALAILNVAVSLNQTLRASVKPSDTVFVYVRVPQGMPMPVAVRRLKVSDLPAQVSLSDADAMLPTMLLSHFERLRVFARVSKSGQARQQKGDLIGMSPVISVPKAGEKAAGVFVEINQLVTADRQ